jgi:hypothetical protein
MKRRHTIRSSSLLKIICKYAKIMLLFKSNLQNAQTCIVYKVSFNAKLWMLGLIEILIEFGLNQITSQKSLSLSINHYMIVCPGKPYRRGRRISTAKPLVLVN